MAFKLYVLLNFILFIIALILLIVSLFIKHDLSGVGKASFYLLFLIINIYRIFHATPSHRYAVYEDTYPNIISGAFLKDKKGYRSLMTAIKLYNDNKYKKAHKLLQKLSKRCTSSKDYAAVHCFHALCYHDEGNLQEAISSYQRALQYNTANSMAWSNMGLCHKNLGQHKESIQAYTNAILYDPKNPYPHVNLATTLLQKKELHSALKFALTAYELNGNLVEPAYVAAIAYQLLGEDENFQRFIHLYQMNGGSLEYLFQTISTMEEEINKERELEK